MSDNVDDRSDGVGRYYTAERREMLKYVPESVGRTLELGCGSGKFSALIKSEYGCECWGVELSEEAAAEAAERMDKVLVGDAVAKLAELPDGHFDCIICNHFLEHLADPYDFLRQLAPKFAAGGMLVAAFPNVRYCKNLYKLVVQGTWDYVDKGIMDRTHLRFFTWKSLAKVLPEVGYEVLRIEGIEPEMTFPARVVKVLNLLLLNAFVDTRFSELAVVARPGGSG